MFSSTAPRRAALATAAAAVLFLAACGGDAEDTEEVEVAAPATSATATGPAPTTPEPTQAPTTPDKTSTPATDASGTASPDARAGDVEPVTGPAELRAELFYVPGSELGGDACQIWEGEIYCLFENATLDPSCTGDMPFTQVTFTGTEVSVECNAGGDASTSPALEICQVGGDESDGAPATFLCEGVDGGVKCTSGATGRTALLTADRAGLLD